MKMTYHGHREKDPIIGSHHEFIWIGLYLCVGFGNLRSIQVWGTLTMQNVTKNTKLIMFPTTILDLMVFVNFFNVMIHVWDDIANSEETPMRNIKSEGWTNHD